MKKVLISQKKRRSPEFGASGSWIQKIFYGTRSGILMNFPSLVDYRFSHHPLPRPDPSICPSASNASAVQLILSPSYQQPSYPPPLFSPTIPPSQQVL